MNPSAVWDRLAAEKGPMRAAWDEADGDGVDECLAAIGDLPDGRILDLGCGPGRLTVPYAERHPASRLVGFDTSKEMTAGLPGAVDDLAGFAPGSFSAAWSVLVFQHLTWPEAFGYFHDLGRLVHPDGVVRVQFVAQHLAGLGADGPLSRPLPAVKVGEWADQAGFDVTHLDMGLVRPTWAWLTGVRR